MNKLTCAFKHTCTVKNLVIDSFLKKMEKKTYLFDTNHMQTCPLIHLYILLDADHVIKLR